MKRRIYSRFGGEDLILRDLLAADRTILANERTFLAFIRTALTLLVAGISFVRFFDHLLIEILGWIFIPLAVVVQVLGTRKYIATRRTLRRLERKADSTSELSGSEHDT